MKKEKQSVLKLIIKTIMVIIRIPVMILSYKSFKFRYDDVRYIYKKYDLQSILKHCKSINVLNVNQKVHREGCLLKVKIRSDYKED